MQALSRFRRYFINEDGNGMSAAIQALNRLDCWPEAIRKLRLKLSPDDATRRLLLNFWNNYGLHSIGRGLRDNLPIFVDLLRSTFLPYDGLGLTLYRGDVQSRYDTGIYGISWTPMLKTARNFAAIRSPEEGQGIVLKVDAKPEMVVVAVSEYSAQTLVLDEDEYILDPRLLHGKVSVVPPGHR